MPRFGYRYGGENAPAQGGVINPAPPAQAAVTGTQVRDALETLEGADRLGYNALNLAHKLGRPDLQTELFLNIQESIYDWRGDFDPTSNTPTSRRLFDVYPAGANLPLQPTEAWNATHNAVRLSSLGPNGERGIICPTCDADPLNLSYEIHFKISTNAQRWGGVNMLLGVDQTPQSSINTYDSGMIISLQRTSSSNAAAWRLFLRDAGHQQNVRAIVGAWTTPDNLPADSLVETISTSTESAYTSRLELTMRQSLYELSGQAWGTRPEDALIRFRVHCFGNEYMCLINDVWIGTFVADSASETWPFRLSNTGEYAAAGGVGHNYGIQSNAQDTGHECELHFFGLSLLDSKKELRPESVHPVNIAPDAKATPVQAGNMVANDVLMTPASTLSSINAWHGRDRGTTPFRLIKDFASAFDTNGYNFTAATEFMLFVLIHNVVTDNTDSTNPDQHHYVPMWLPIDAMTNQFRMFVAAPQSNIVPLQEDNIGLQARVDGGVLYFNNNHMRTATHRIYAVKT